MKLVPLKLDKATGKLVPETAAEISAREAAYVEKANAEPENEENEENVIPA